MTDPKERILIEESMEWRELRYTSNGPINIGCLTVSPGLREPWWAVEDALRHAHGRPSAPDPGAIPPKGEKVPKEL